MRPQPKRQPAPDETGQLAISLAGPPDLVRKLLRALAGGLDDDAPLGAPEPLYVGRDEAARLTGLGRDRLSRLVRDGYLTNYGTPAKLRFSLAQVRAWQEDHPGE